MWKNLLLLFFSITAVLADDVDILCRSTSCESVKCPSIPENCKIQNATHRGIFLPSPEKCNCCDYCITYLNEGDDCTEGSIDTLTPTSMCGAGLTCTNLICSKMTTPCVNDQADYDNREKTGAVGTMEVRANCDDSGDYAPYKCIPGQSCYCVHRNGSRIFGLSDFSSIPTYTMPCDCSRSYYEAADIMGRALHPIEHFRCKANGDYDSIQCINEQCFCVNYMDGAPTNPTASTVNRTLISADTLSCFDKDFHRAFVYYQKCEEEYMEVLNEVREYEASGFEAIEFFYPKCDIDGTYSPVQENATHKFCVDPSGIIQITLDKTANSKLTDIMDCKCIRALSVTTSKEKPECDTNGNYKSKQCRRGTCRCVDGDGNQICKSDSCEGDKQTLTC